jgi:hypothetical protein
MNVFSVPPNYVASLQENLTDDVLRSPNAECRMPQIDLSGWRSRSPSAVSYADPAAVITWAASRLEHGRFGVRSSFRFRDGGRSTKHDRTCRIEDVSAAPARHKGACATSSVRSCPGGLWSAAQSWELVRTVELFPVMRARSLCQGGSQLRAVAPSGKVNWREMMTSPRWFTVSLQWPWM